MSERTTEIGPQAAAGPGSAADILALGRAAIDALGRVFRSAPEVKASRVMARWPIDLEGLLQELEPMQAETSISELAARLGVSTAQLRSTALRLQRLSLVKVNADGVALTALGRQKLARLEGARAAVLRRLAVGLEGMSDTDARRLVELLGHLIERADAVAEAQVSSGAVGARRSGHG